MAPTVIISTGSPMRLARADGWYLARAPERSPPRMPPWPPNMWQERQLASNSPRPFTSLPVGRSVTPLSDARNAATARASASGMGMAGICVPGMPLMMLRTRSSSVPPCFQSPVVRSGPRPPLAVSPWQAEQLLTKIFCPARTVSECCAKESAAPMVAIKTNFIRHHHTNESI